MIKPNFATVPLISNLGHELETSIDIPSAFGNLESYLGRFGVEQILYGVRHRFIQVEESEGDAWGYYGTYPKAFQDWYAVNGYVANDPTLRWPDGESSSVHYEMWRSPDLESDKSWFGSLTGQQLEFEQKTREFGLINGASFTFMRSYSKSYFRFAFGLKCFDWLSRSEWESTLSKNWKKISLALALFHAAAIERKDYENLCRIRESGRKHHYVGLSKLLLEAIYSEIETEILREALNNLSAVQIDAILGLRPQTRVEIIQAILSSEFASNSGDAKESIGESPLKLPEQAPAIYAARGRHPLSDLPSFLRRVWGPWIKAGLLTRRELRRLDPSAERAVQNWLRTAPLPEDVRLPTVREVNDALLEAQGIDAREVKRLAAAVHRRQKRKT